MSAEKHATYICETAPSLKMRVIDGDAKTPDVYVQFENKVLKLDVDCDAVTIAALDGLIATRSNVRQLIRKVNMDAAVAMVKKHIAETQSLAGQVKGPMTAAHLNALKVKQHSDNLRVQMEAEGATPEQIAAAIKDLEADGLIIAVQGDPPANTPSDGFIPKPAPVQGPGSQAEPGKLKLNLPKK